MSAAPPDEGHDGVLGRLTGDAGEMTPTQARVSTICAEILGLTRVGVDDDIFDLGGDSQQAVLIALRIEATLPVVLPLETMESNTTVRAIAAWIDAEMGNRGRGGPLLDQSSG